MFFRISFNAFCWVFFIIIILIRSVIRAQNINFRISNKNRGSTNIPITEMRSVDCLIDICCFTSHRESFVQRSTPLNCMSSYSFVLSTNLAWLFKSITKNNPRCYHLCTCRVKGSRLRLKILKQIENVVNNSTYLCEKRIFIQNFVFTKQ